MILPTTPFIDYTRYETKRACGLRADAYLNRTIVLMKSLPGSGQ